MDDDDNHVTDNKNYVTDNDDNHVTDGKNYVTDDKKSVSGDDDSDVMNNRTAVTIVGVAESSGLLAVDDQGQRYELLPDGNSFDFLQGLIKRKI